MDDQPKNISDQPEPSSPPIDSPPEGATQPTEATPAEEQSQPNATPIVITSDSSPDDSPPQPSYDTLVPPTTASPQPPTNPDLPQPPAAESPRPKAKRKKLVWLLVFIVVIAAASAIAVLGLSGHTSAPEPPVSNGNPTLPQNPKNVVDAHNAFGFNMLRALGAQDDTQNVFISPTSIALDLSMVYNGAAGSTQTAMAKTLQLQNLSTNQVNQQSLSLINALKTPDPDVTLSIADSVWVRKDFPVKPSFSTTVSNFYNAKIANLDFNSPAATQTMNDWVSTNTHGKIPTIVSQIQPSDVMFLINATYFKGSWTTAFDPSQTHTKTFTTGQGSTTKVPMMMQQQNNFSYPSTKSFQSISLPYGASQRYAMDIFLPNNLPSFVNQLTISKWDQWMNEYQDEQGTLLMPRFTLNYAQELKYALTKLGMGVAFGSNANLNGIANNLYISSVLHKSYVNVDEQGTEAAAATVTDVAVGDAINAQPPKTFYMNVNRPFFFAIQDSQTNEVLFSGVVENP